MPLKYQRPRGTHDLYPGAPPGKTTATAASIWKTSSAFSAVSTATAEIRTPAFRRRRNCSSVRSVKPRTSSPRRCIRSLTKGERSLTLRPESTAPVLRAYVENSLHAQGGVAKLYYCAPTSAMSEAEGPLPAARAAWRRGARHRRPCAGRRSDRIGPGLLPPRRHPEPDAETQLRRFAGVPRGLSGRPRKTSSSRIWPSSARRVRPVLRPTPCACWTRKTRANWKFSPTRLSSPPT